MIAVVEALALVSAILFVVWSDLPVNPVAILSGVALALLVWLQVKKHHELAQSYALAAHELGLIHESAQHVGTEEELSQFVSDSENAMSREQTLWLARRDVV